MEADRQEIELLRQMVVRLSRLVEISVTLNSTLDLNRLLQFIVHSAADLLDSESASLLLVDEHSQDLMIAAATDIEPDELASVPVLKEGSIAGTILREDRPLILNGLEPGMRAFEEIEESLRFEVRSLIGVPLRIRDSVTGVLEAANKRVGVFDEADLQTLTNVASLAAVAIYNARQLEALNRAYEELGKLEKLKSDFIAIASHELRTPLGLILGNAALLKDMTDERVGEYAEAVLSSAERMRELVEDMTSMNMMEAGSAEVAMALQPLQPIAQAAYDQIVGLAKAKGQNLELRLPKEPILAMADRPKLEVALTNLLNNAVRFTPEGGKLWLVLEPHGREAWLRVGDNGIGIPPDQLDTVFDLFYQVEDHLTRRHGGMGMGLAIVKAIAEAHGGRVWVESEGPGAGATFTLALPLG